MFMFLDLSYMRNLSANALHQILKVNPNLRCLYLERSIYAGVDSTLQVLGSKCPLLKTLSVCYCSRITDTGIQCLSLGCKYLRDLNLGHCSDVSSIALREMLQRCRLIKVLSLECKNEKKSNLLNLIKLTCELFRVHQC